MRRRVPLIAFGSLVLFAAFLVAASWLRDRRILQQIFGKWSAEQVSRLSEGVYQISFSDPEFNLGRRRVWMDSIALVTDTVRLAARQDSLPRLRIVLRDCQLTGVRLISLALGRGLDARKFGCENVEIDAQIPALRSRPRPVAERQDRPFMVVTREIELPAKVPAIRIRGVMFPRTALHLVQRRHSGAQVSLSLLLDWRLRAVNLDPTDPVAMRRPLFSEDVTVEADSVRFRPEPNVETRIGHIAVGVTDSTLELRDFAYGPTISDEARARTQKYRSARIRASAARVAYAGLDLTQLTEGNGLSMRRLEVDSARLDVLTDKRLPKAPRAPAKLTPQEWIRELDRGVEVDSVIVTNSAVVYREMHPDRLAPGVLTFDRINAVATHVRHEPGRSGLHDPMRLSVTTRLMEHANLRARFDVPLDAPNFALTVRGEVGPMDVTQMNQFIQRVAPVTIKSGKLDAVRFEIAVQNGFAHGTVVPLYDDLALDLNGRGMKGILGGKGFVSGVARSVAEIAINELGVHRANPGDGQDPRAGRVAHEFTTDETLPAFLWNGIRDGLVRVVKKRNNDD